MADGQIEAPGRQEAFRLLEGRGLIPVDLTGEVSQRSGPGHGLAWPWRVGKVSGKALENFTRQLSSLLAAGVPLSRALRIVGHEASSLAASEKWKEIYNLVIDGTSLAEAMGKTPETFPRVYVAMTQAGETGGFLDVVLGQIAEFQARQKELRSKVFSALIYPSVLMVLAISVLIFLLVFFIPRFQQIFEGFGAALPALTRFIVAVSEGMAHYGPLAALALVAAAVVARKWLKTEQGRRAWERVELRIPVIGPLVARYAMARFCRMLGTLVGAGVPLISALSVARGSIGNQTLVDALAESIERVKRGDSLAASLSDCGSLFPGSVLEMIAVAEETGKLNLELVRLASVTEADLDRNLRTAVALAEPLMLFLMAGFIGVIFVGMVIPIFSIQEYIQ